VPLVGIQGIAIASVVILIPIVAMVYQLIGFHLMLIKNDITTYEFVVNESNKSRTTPKQPTRTTPQSTSKKASEYGDLTTSKKDLEESSL